MRRPRFVNKQLEVYAFCIIVFAAMATYLRYRKLKAAQLVPTAQAAQPAE